MSSGDEGESTAPVERQIDRPETTKCQTYGRAGIALLGRGFLLAA